MIRRTVFRRADGTVRTQIRVMQAYRPYPGHNPKQRTIKDFGYLEDQTDLESFWAEVNACNDSLQKQKSQTISIPVSDKIDMSIQQSLNYGYKFIESALCGLGINKIIGNDWTPLKYLIVDQIIHKGTVRESLARYPFYYGMTEETIKVKHFYHDLSITDEYLLDTQMRVSSVIKNSLGKSVFPLIAINSEYDSTPKRRSSILFEPCIILNKELEPQFIVPLFLDSQHNQSELIDTIEKKLGSKEHVMLSNKIALPSLHELKCNYITYNIELDNDSNTDGIAMDTNLKAYDDSKLLELCIIHRNIAHGLKAIRDDFGTKIPLVNKRGKVAGLFLSCVISLIVVRSIQACMGENKISIGRISEALRMANCVVLDRGGYIMLLDMSQSKSAAEDYRLLQNVFGVDFYYSFSKQENFNRFLKELKLKGSG